MKPSLIIRAAACHAMLASLAAAFTPTLSLIEPRGGQRGTELQVTLTGDRLGSLTEALVFQPGLTLTGIEPAEDGQSATATLAIAADAPLGEHSVRLRGTHGVTELRSFFVGQFPSVDEVEPNNSFDEAQRVELNTTVHGVAGNEDEDYYVVTLKKGQRLSAEVEAMRLGRVMFDAYVAILDPRRFEIATCDDAVLLRTDSFVSIIAPEDGDYRIVVREAAYEGNNNCQYRVHIGTFPRPSAVFPPGGMPGEEIEFTFLGDPAGEFTQTLTLPSDAAGMVPVFPVRDGLSAPSPNWVHVAPIAHTVETEGNNGPKTATPMLPVPSAVHGILSDGQTADWYRFEAKKDEALVIRVIARALRSPLDSVLSLRDAAYKQLATNDDQGGPDSLIAWTCPEDGEYFIQIRDQLGNTGDDFTYRLEVVRREPAIAATLPTVERVQTQKWKTFSVPRGNRYAAVVNLSRENIACDITFAAESLPAGITLHAPPVTRAMNSFPVVFEAAADAPVAGGLHAFTIHSAGDAPELAGRLTDTINHIDINNQGAYHSVTVDRIATAVIERAPFTIDLEPPRTPLAQNGMLNLNVKVTRDEGYDEKITVRFLWRPPGITGPVTLEIPAGQSELLYELNASADAAVAEWSICVLAEANTPQGPVLVSSALVPLQVVEPYVALTLDLAAAEQGKPSVMIGKLDVAREFSGSATAELVGLPHGVSAAELTFASDATELKFPLEIAADATLGKHVTVFCRIQIPENGDKVLHQTAHGGTVRVDAPPPAPVAKAADEQEDQPAAQAAATTPEDKPLSRLEQLRQRAN
jgi:hypothetical protein